MSLKTINPRTSLLVLFILLTAALRIFSAGGTLTPLVNFTPIGAMALFGGCHFKTTWKRYLFPLLTLFVSDIVMMRTIYTSDSNGFLYTGWYWIYLAFAVMVMIGQYIRKVSFKSVVTAAAVAAVSHWIITDFGVWLGGGLNVVTMLPYTRDWQGLVQCYILAIPFMKNMLVGNLLYGGIMFSSFEYLQKRYPVLQLQ